MYKFKMKIFYEKIIIFLFSILLLFDSINGYLIRVGGPSVSSAYKVLLCIFLMIVIIFTNRKVHINRNRFLLFLVFLILTLFSVFVNILNVGINGIHFNFVIKLFFNALLLVLLLKCNDITVISGESFYKILNNSSWMLIICYIVPYLLDMGYGVYSGGIGYKAFFYSQNELSFVIIVLCYFSLYKLTLKISVTNIMQVGLILICALLLNTKSTVLACLMGFCVYGFFVLLKLPVKYKLSIIVFAGLGGVVLYDTIYSSFLGIIRRFKSLNSTYNDGSFIRVLLSDRNTFMKEEWLHLLNEKNFLFKFLFGNGFSSSKLVEMDLIDIFFFLGLVGLIIVIIFLIIIFMKIFNNIKHDISSIRLISFIMIMVFMNITGHVLFVSMSGYYFSIYLCFLLCYRKKQL